MHGDLEPLGRSHTRLSIAYRCRQIARHHTVSSMRCVDSFTRPESSTLQYASDQSVIEQSDLVTQSNVDYVCRTYLLIFVCLLLLVILFLFCLNGAYVSAHSIQLFTSFRLDATQNTIQSANGFDLRRRQILSSLRTSHVYISM